jgi:hypothetical protein
MNILYLVVHCVCHTNFILYRYDSPILSFFFFLKPHCTAKLTSAYISFDAYCLLLIIVDLYLRENKMIAP